MPRRFGRPGLVGTMARTAVIAGTAQAVTGKVAANQQAAAQAQQAQAQQAQAQQAPPPATSAGGDVMAQLTQLNQMHAASLIDDAEFAAAKAKLLGI
jgi:membrane protease subunit (stomatin/prohibitin family)